MMTIHPAKSGPRNAAYFNRESKGQRAPARSERPTQHFEDRLELHPCRITSSANCLCVCVCELRSETVRITIPQRMCDDFGSTATAARLQPPEGLRLPTRHRVEVRRRRRNVNPLPVRNGEVDRSGGVQREPCEIQAEAPVENAVIRQIAEITQAVRARGRAGTWSGPCVLLAHEKAVEGWLRSAADHVLEQRFGFGRLTQERSVSSAVLQAIRQEDLSDDPPAGSRRTLRPTLISCSCTSRRSAAARRARKPNE